MQFGLDQPLGWSYEFDRDDGFFADEVFVNRNHPAALGMRSSLQIDPQSRYAYSVFESTQRPGNEVCHERLQIGDEQVERVTFEQPGPGFVTSSDPGAFDEPLVRLFPALAAEVWHAVGRDAPAGELVGERQLLRERELDSLEVAAAIGLLPNATSAIGDYTSGLLQTVELASGELVEFSLDAQHVGPEDTVHESGVPVVIREVDRMRARFSIGNFAGAAVTTSTQLGQPGGCAARTNWLAGDWTLYSVVTFDPLDQAQTVLSESDGSGQLAIFEDGTFSGFIGCTKFSGTTSDGFFERPIEKVEFETECTEATRWESVALRSFENASFGVDTTAQLFVLSEDEDGISLAAASFLPPEMLLVD